MSSIPDNSQPDDGDRTAQHGPTLEVEVVIDAVLGTSHNERGITADQIGRAARAAAAHRGCDRGCLGVRVSDDEEIRRLNREFLQHDYATDVISFGYALAPPRLEGELVVSLETAGREAAARGGSLGAELLLYVVHGVLHIAGLDDHSDEQRTEMRAAEQAVLKSLGVDSCTAVIPATTAHVEAGTSPTRELRS